MNRTQCPDCHSGLRPPYASCVCGWVEPVRSRSVPSEAGVHLPCDTTGCGDEAWIRDGEQNLCRRCHEGKRNTEAFERCKAKGLNTVADMQAYCRQSLKKGLFGRPSFERWAETMKQGTVDTMLRMATLSDEKTLERLRTLCVIDAENKVIPVVERQALRDALEAKIRAERERVAKLLGEQGVVRRSDVDTEAAA